MNRTEKKVLLSVFAVMSFLILIIFLGKHILLFLFSICGFSSIYTDRGQISIRSGDQIIFARIYTSGDAPYTLIGPYPFPEQKDFFFIRKDEVVGRCLDDKIENDFFILFRWLFISFDLSSHLDAMAPHFVFDAKIKRDKTDSKYIYRFSQESQNHSAPEISFSIDQKFLR